MFKKYDRVRVVNLPKDSIDLYYLLGKEGTVIDVDSNADYPYEVIFFDKQAQNLSEWNGVILFTDWQLQNVLDIDVEGAKKDIQRLRKNIRYKEMVSGIEVDDALRRIETML